MPWGVGKAGIRQDAQCTHWPVGSPSRAGRRAMSLDVGHLMVQPFEQVGVSRNFMKLFQKYPLLTLLTLLSLDLKVLGYAIS